MITPANTERFELYRDLSQTAQEIRLLADILDTMVTSATIEDLMRMIESGVKSVLPSSDWTTIELALLDDSGKGLRCYEIGGGAASRYWNNVRAGATASATDLGVRLNYVTGDAETQVVYLQEAIDNRADGIAIAPIDSTAAEPLFAAARAVSVPVLTFDTPPISKSAALAYIGTDNFAAGQLAGEALCRLLPDGGEVGVSLDSVVSENGIDRVMGAETAVGGTEIRMLPPYEEQLNPQLGLQPARQMLEQHPELRGAFGASGSTGPNWAAAAREYGRGGQFKIVSFDLVADTIHQLQEGIVHAAVAQREYDMGYRSVEMLCRIALDGVESVLADLPANRVIDTGVDLVTLERTDWSVALADYLRGADYHRPDFGLCQRVSALEQPLNITMIAMAEVGERSMIERRAKLDRESVAGQVLTSGQTLLTSGTDKARTVVGVPLISRGNVLGVLRLESPNPDACAPHDLKLLERMTGALAMVVENTRLFRQLDRRAREIEEAYSRQEAMLQTISELSSTVVPIARGVLVVPMVGTIDTRRAAMFVETLLTSISERQAQVVLIDITGVAVVDTSVAHHIIQAAQAAQLLGAETIVVGITPAVAQTVVQLGVNMRGIRTFADLETGFAYALTRVGGRLVYSSKT